MKTSLLQKVAAFATVAMSTLAIWHPTTAATFDQTEVDQSKFIAIAAPFGEKAHQLLIIEQLSPKRQCWSESGSNPVAVEPLLLNFDFTGICGRSTDSNGYSIRVAEQDLGLDYLLRVVERDGELQLVGTHRSDRKAPEIILGRTYGLSSGFSKIFLGPEWRFTRRTYQGKTLGHVYLSSNTVAVGPGTGTGSNPGTGTGSNPGTGTGSNPGTGTGNPVSTFRDIAADVYASEIEQAVALGFVAGFREDNTFRPQVALTREQLVSMALEGLGKLPNANLQIPSQVSSRPYPDVDASRWSAAKIQWARDNNIVSGYTDGNFRPTQPVTRAELMAVERRAAEFALTLQGKQPVLTLTQSPTLFSDTQGHWAASLISQMSSYCQVASPFNESGSAFYPNTETRRNYAAAATLRMLNCVKSEQTSSN